MSALRLDDRRSTGGIFAYAPRRGRRADDGASIRPVLERLSRGEGREPGPRLVRKAVVHHAAPPGVEAMAKTPIPMVARLVIAAGLAVATAVIGAGVFIPHDTMHASASKSGAAQSSETSSAPAVPKAVHTLAIRKGDDAAASSTVIKDAERVRQTEAVPPAAASASAAVTGPSSAEFTPTADPVGSPLALWAMLPADVAPVSSGTGQTAVDEAPSARDGATKPEAGASSHKTIRTHRARHSLRHRRPSRHRVALAPAEPAAPQPAQPQPVKKLPLQAAIDRLFNNQNAATPAPPQQR
jgi:hypothetical protein